MSDQVQVIHGVYQLEVLGSVNLASRGPDVHVSALADNADLVLSSMGRATLTAGPALVSVVGDSDPQAGVVIAAGPSGSIIQNAGTPGMGPSLLIDPDAITLMIGPPGVGASIKLTTSEIVLQIGPTKLSLTPTGISESLAEIKRQVTPIGHQLSAGPTSVQVNVTGVTEKGPMKQETFDAATTSKQALANESTDGVRTIKAGILMLG